MTRGEAVILAKVAAMLFGVVIFVLNLRPVDVHLGLMEITVPVSAVAVLLLATGAVAGLRFRLWLTGQTARPRVARSTERFTSVPRSSDRP